MDQPAQIDESTSSTAFMAGGDRRQASTPTTGPFLANGRWGQHWNAYLPFAQDVWSLYFLALVWDGERSVGRLLQTPMEA